MLQCEGYKMFKGTMAITPVSRNIPPFRKHGTWLYKPEYDCWYCNDSTSYTANICNVISEDKE